jgi:hypothetical protein
MRQTKLVVRWLLVVLALIASAGAPTAAADTDTYVGSFRIVNMGTGRCLDAFYSDGGGNGNRVGLWDCNGGITELWHAWLHYDENRGEFSYRFLNARNGRALDYPQSSAGDIGYQYELWVDHPWSSTQRFRLSSDQRPGWQMISLWGGGIMDAFASGGGGNGSPVGNWLYTGHPLQHWKFECVYSPCNISSGV